MHPDADHTLLFRMKITIACTTEIKKCLSIDNSSSSNIKVGFF